MKMGRDYKKSRKANSENKRVFFLYDYEQLTQALNAIKNGMPTSTASKLYNVPRTTLRNKITGYAPKTSGRTGPESILGKEIEDQLCQWILTCSQMGFPVTRDGLCFSVKKILDETNIQTPFKNNIPGKTWFKSFLKRHPRISLKQSEYLNKARANITPEKIKNWFKETEELLGENVAVLKEPSRVFNMDETAFYLNPKGGLVLAERGKHVYSTSANSDKENITTLITVNALGKFAPPLTIYKFERLPDSYTKSAPRKWGIGKSKNGWMTAATFFEYFTNVFYPFLIEEKFTLPVVVFLDGHSSHLSIQLSRFCREKEIIVVCLYPNTTHILQPLDVALFHPLKCKWKKMVHSWRIENNGREIRKMDVPTVLNKLITENSFSSTIINGFKVCGLFPFNSENVDYSKCTLKRIDTTEPISTPTKQNLSHLEYLEEKMHPNVLTDFENCRTSNEKPKDLKAHMLYEVWLKFKYDDTENYTEILNIEEVGCTSAEITNHNNQDVLEFPFPEFEDLFSSVDDSIKDLKTNEDKLLKESIQENTLFQAIEVDKFNDSSELNQNGKSELSESIQNHIDDNPLTNNSILDLKTQGIEHYFDNHLIVTETQDYREEINNENSKQLEKGTLESEKNDHEQTGQISMNKNKAVILSNILVYPSTSNEPKKKTRRGRPILPSVLTSDKWLELAEAKEKENEELLLQKEKRKKKREENAKKKEIGITKKESRESKISERVDASPVLIRNVAGEYALENKRIDVGDYLIVQYEEKYYPGKLTAIKKNKFLVSVMVPSGTFWKWPEKKDEIYYEKGDIKEVIKEPVQKNARGAYLVPEIEKFLDFTQ